MSITENDSITVTCCLTGKTRPSSRKFFKNKAARLGIDESTLLRYYVCREALVQAVDHGRDLEKLAGKSVDLQQLLSEKSWGEIVKINNYRGMR